MGTDVPAPKVSIFASDKRIFARSFDFHRLTNFVQKYKFVIDGFSLVWAIM